MISNWFRQTNNPVHPVSGLLLGALVMSVVLSVMLASDGAMAFNPRSVTVPVRFLYRDCRAQRVCVMGSFNEWSSQAHCMERKSDEWSITIMLVPGRYQYLFLIDGKVRQKDPGASLTQDNGFGEENCVLVVE